MRLSKIKLAGFKSFVDPTTVPFTTNLTGVVGPNGCGKSNIIDAVRWVMGESSAKNLRGESMTDVIFNGSSSRKPVGVASIELTFDNSDGSYGGQYANFSEISIKRQVSRDGQSNYFLNNSRCRRRDITDIFLGTGLGPRSYAIIEQGTISRLIEAKPDELRIFLEEAAGISKYKERRRETANRIRHTRENLDRLNDLREELGKQLSHLQRQAQSAERYKALKQEERQQKGELQALRWQMVDSEARRREEVIAERERVIEAIVANQRRAEAGIEKLRQEQSEATEAFNQVQSRFYGVGAEIARLEQSIQHGREQLQQQQRELEQIEGSCHESEQHLNHDRGRKGQIEATLAQLEPDNRHATELATTTAATLTDAEQRMEKIEREWESFTTRAAEPSQQAQVERARIQQLEQGDSQLTRRFERMQIETEGLTTTRLEEEITELKFQLERLTEEREILELKLEEGRERVRLLRDEIATNSRSLNQELGQMQKMRGRYASLETLQQAALGQQKSRGGEGSAARWLQQQGLEQIPAIGQRLEVEAGWEQAVETVLAAKLQAVPVPQLTPYIDALPDLKSGEITLISTEEYADNDNKNSRLSLFSKVNCDVVLAPLLASVFTADSLQDALERRPSLSDGESLITAEGIWVGRNWLWLKRGRGEQSGLLLRGQEMKEIAAAIDESQQRIDAEEAQGERRQQQLTQGEREQEEQTRRFNQLNGELNTLKSQLSGKEVRLEQIEQRRQRLEKDQQDLLQERQGGRQQIERARSSLHEALEQIEIFAMEREDLQGRRQQQRHQLDASRRQGREAQQQAHNLNLRFQTLSTELESLRQAEERVAQQLRQLQQRQRELQQQLQAGDGPIIALQQELEQRLHQRLEVEEQLAAARKRVGEIDHAIRQLEGERNGAERQHEGVRNELDQLRMEFQEQKVRRQTLQERVAESGLDLQQLLQQLEEGATVEVWQQRVEETGRRISRLGPINLAAIDEFKAQSERKGYLDAQNEDLVQALETLETAIQKIDKETRNRFRETFDRVNSGLQEKFPRLFGGGHAYLELTGDDLLDTGVTVMARPPGKRNSTIHLLSGGEKALTAVALVFAIFELNPSPFCMLDEVDAPLDEANVGRFCSLVQEMSQQVQFIFITHNKTTMELSSALIGVTMHEPGVSRMVAVDVDEAVELAAVG
ncbi:MAG: chromosome segregation protein SMC [Gammaproteobacteria bacterium]|nr:chromosome segregation protein SMC [Gammaproteobacteria bacterium]